MTGHLKEWNEKSVLCGSRMLHKTDTLRQLSVHEIKAIKTNSQFECQKQS